MTDAPTHRQSVAAVALGAVAMSVIGLQALLLGALGAAGRFTAGEAHWAILAEVTSMGLAVALAGAFLPPRRLRAVGIAAICACAVLNLAMAVTTGERVIALRAAAGLAEGVMVWITIGFLARSERPKPWAAGFFLSQAVGQLVLAAVLAVAVLPAFGPTGGVVMAALAILLALPAAAMTAPAYETLAAGPLPSLRGSVGLFALLLYVTASAGVWFHMREFALAAGLGEAPMRYAVISTLAGQIAGAALAVALAGRVGFIPVFAAVCALTLGAWGVLALHPPTAAFVAAFAISGFAGMLLGTWIFSFLVEVEPSRRAAAVSAAAQLAGSVLGPLMAAPLAVNAALVVLSFVLVVWLSRSQRMELTAGRP